MTRWLTENEEFTSRGVERLLEDCGYKNLDHLVIRITYEDKNMSRRKTKKEGQESLRERTTQKYVVPESEMRDFVGSLGVLDISNVAARFQVIADLTSNAFEEQRDDLGSSDTALIKRIADEDKSPSYRHLMDEILISTERGRHGINAAHLTASRLVELAFRCTRDYFSALHSYRRYLRLELLQRSVEAAYTRRRPANPQSVAADRTHPYGKTDRSNKTRLT